MHSEKQKPIISQKSLDQLPISSVEMGRLMQDVLSLDTPIQIKATGSSMKPFILDGDVLTITPVSRSQPTTGKVVAFLISGNRNLVVHRIIKNKDLLFLTKGDNSWQKTDGWIDGDQILGCVTHIKREENNIRFGLGVERVLLAFLSRHNLLKRITIRLGNR